MEIQDILNFAHSLLSAEDINALDKGIAGHIQNNFAQRVPQEELTPTDIEFILGCFQSRWQRVPEDPTLDYTIYPTRINMIWMEFAKSFVTLANKGNQTLLFPVSDNTKQSILGSEQSTKFPIQKLSDIHRCFTLVVSLLVTEFEYFRGNNISLWDKSNTVFGVASQISVKIFPLLEDNKYDELVNTYKEVLDALIIPGASNPGFFGKTMHPHRATWFNHIKSGDLSEWGIYWFEPEIMMQVLRSYKAKNKEIHEQIITFLDQLIHTYGMHYNRMMKAIRVNVIFYSFIKKFEKAELCDLIRQLSEVDYETAKNSFILHCAQFINYKLRYMSPEQSSEGPQDLVLYSEDNTEGFIPDLMEIDTVGKLITAIKDKLHSRDHKLDSTTRLLSSYLIKLTNPILSVKEKEEVDRTSRQADYLNSPT